MLATLTNETIRAVEVAPICDGHYEGYDFIVAFPGGGGQRGLDRHVI